MRIAILILPFDTHYHPCRIDAVPSSFKAAQPPRIEVTCRSGGIGRRAWFRSMYPQGCGGSSPFFGTIRFNQSGGEVVFPCASESASLQTANPQAKVALAFPDFSRYQTPFRETKLGLAK